MTSSKTAIDGCVFSRNPRIEEAPLSGEVMLFDPESSKFFVLNRTMAFVWRRCGREHTVAKMVDDLKQEFDGVEPGSAETDVRTALDEAISLGLIVAEPSRVR